MEYGRAKPSNYFSLDDIVATQEKIPCRFKVAITQVGALLNTQTKSDEIIKPGVKVEVPIWLAESLSREAPIICEPEIPRLFKENYLEIFMADACAVDLHKLLLHFYTFGVHVARFDPTGKVTQVLRKMFKQRFRIIFDLAQNMEIECADLYKLDRLERDIFEAAHKALNKWRAWHVSDHDSVLQAADMVVSLRKRKQAEEQCL